MLTKDEVIKIAQLARIELTEAEVEKFQKELSTVLDYVEELKQVDVTGLEEVSQVTGLVNVQRDDKVVEPTEELLEDIFKNAPEMKDGYYKVKAIL
jgi:aspartyl-tRNA(Asn)/glutamyl-tRNA(Gln) amidotransferase subunit C